MISIVRVCAPTLNSILSKTSCPSPTLLEAKILNSKFSNSWKRFRVVECNFYLDLGPEHYDYPLPFRARASSYSLKQDKFILNQLVSYPAGKCPQNALPCWVALNRDPSNGYHRAPKRRSLWTCLKYHEKKGYIKHITLIISFAVYEHIWNFLVKNLIYTLQNLFHLWFVLTWSRNRPRLKNTTLIAYLLQQN